MASKRSRENFRKKVGEFYRLNRRSFPWRNTHNPYRILISEIMLQQTQTDRVVSYYKNFLKEFPTVKELAEAPLERVLRLWQGLGYNRRARYLLEMAKVIVRDFKGKIPADAALLQTLPGIGAYTASAVCVFAFNQPRVLLETNVRAVYIHAFFKDRSDVHDRELMPLIEATIDSEDPREWFYALMDYGSYLKKQDRSVTGRSRHYVRQSRFAGSRRQLRGIILRRLLEKKALGIEDLSDLAMFSPEIQLQALEQLSKEGMISKIRGKYRLAGK